MAQDVAVNTFTGTKLLPAERPELAVEREVNIGPSLTLAQGKVMAQLTSGQSDVQTLTVTGTPTGGTLTVTATNPGGATVTFDLAYNSSASAAQTAAQAVLGSGNVTVSGGALPGTPLVFTFAGSIANQYVPAMTVNASALTGGTSPAASFAHTTSGASPGTYVAYDSTVVAAPTTAPTVAGNGSGSSYAAGTYAVAYTLVTAYGESIPSPATNVTVTAAQNLRVSAISSLNAAVTAVNYYVNGLWAKQTAVSSGTAAQTDISGASLATGASPPTANTAYTCPNGAGCHVARGLLAYATATDSSGYVTYGTASGGDQWGQTRRTASVYVSGLFACQDLSGLDAKAVADMGRLQTGTTATGVISIG